MATKFRFQFECGHAANATNDEALRVIRFEGVNYRFCPRCHRLIGNRIQRCIVNGTAKRPRIFPLPDSEE